MRGTIYKQTREDEIAAEIVRRECMTCHVR